MLVSDRNSKECMIHRCPDCPDSSKLFEYLTEQIIGYDEEDVAEGDIIYDNSEQMSFQQWVSTDRSELITQTLSQKEFIQTLAGKLSTLTAHSFISKEQARHLKDCKENLKDNECIILLGFAENFKFVIEDEVQSYH